MSDIEESQLETPIKSVVKSNPSFSKPRSREMERSFDVCLVEEVNRAGTVEIEYTPVGSAFKHGDKIRVVLKQNIALIGTFEIVDPLVRK